MVAAREKLMGSADPLFGELRPKRVATGLSGQETLCCLSAVPTVVREHWHYHSDFELQLIEAEAGTLFVGDFVGAVEGPQLLLLGPGLPHHFLPQPDHPVTGRPLSASLYFSANLETASVSGIPELAALQPLVRRAARGIAFEVSALEGVQVLFHRIRASSGLLRFSLFLQLVTRLSSCERVRELCSSGGAAGAPAVGARRAQRFEATIAFIEQHYDRELSLASVAAAMDMSAKSLSRLFKQETGQGVMEFVNQFRICEACRRLVSTETPITEICHDVGFNNISNFNRRFLALKGMTPSRYRKAFSAL